MNKTAIVAFFALLLIAAYQTPNAQGQGGFEKKNFGHHPWAKGRFSESVTVTGPGKLIFLAGIGPEDEQTGEIRHKDNFLEQCRLSYRKVKNILKDHDATMNDVVRATVFVTDIRVRDDYRKCKDEAYAGVTAQPAGTFVNVTALAWPHMMFEVEVTAAVAK
ncbi:MAG: 2-iminobutanoate/2-iminopropanoate deaminase [Alphaproteobacteria bacterium]|jgi:enamine deaminase RidA (YjgF/YER057c/UK114 family)|nr:2-iminobutanoate/2-iminopropanoate deaminase [Alphaproteobacteria bacterium]